MGCSTGLRYSDVVRLTPQNVVGDSLIADITKTEGAQLRIPLNEISSHFLNKQFSKYGRVKEISNQKLNAVLTGLTNPEKPDELPEGGLFRFISEEHSAHPFSDMVIKLERYGNRTVSKKIPKWLALSFHSSRKYFISYLVNVARVDIGNVMAWSGHTNLQTVNSYIERGQRQKEVMQEAFKRKKE
ncbi:MAG: tyrosine-type recombinase/integrase [Bacteroidales bacterium]|nr:tyrosine-type recombinase/integrase [Bacteroidales bacterium]